jgi:hypothetical protein
MTYEEYVDQSLAEVARIGIRYEDLQEDRMEDLREGRKEGLRECWTIGRVEGAKEILFITLRNRYSDLSPLPSMETMRCSGLNRGLPHSPKDAFSAVSQARSARSWQMCAPRWSFA